MIHLDIPQNTPEWHHARLGIPTASQFSRVITPKTRKPSSQQQAYLAELLVEWISGEKKDEQTTAWMDRGHDLEPLARRWYEWEQDATVTPAGFCYRDETRLAGASCDGFVGEDGLVELKAPMLHTHVGYLLGEAMPDTYVAQVQGQLWVTGRQWCDWCSYHPDMPPTAQVCIRVEPDPKFQKALDTIMGDFCERLQAARERLAGLGVQPALQEKEEGCSSR